jgi:hypothetical protein
MSEYTYTMKLTKTIMLKLKEADDILDETIGRYTEGMNFTSKLWS